MISTMTERRRNHHWTRRTGIEILGWSLVVVGLAALVLPGPGLLMVSAGLFVLSQQYAWAERRLHPIKRQALRAAEEGVRTTFRITVACLSALTGTLIGVYWFLQPPAPGWWPLKDEWWLFGGVGVGISLVISGLIAFSLIFYSVHRFRVRGELPPH
ncbi:PGPGW domain-containing protein [Arthrobacter roseus]